VLVRDPGLAEAMGHAGRDRAVAEFGWPAVAQQTAALYAELVSSSGR
jgi:starch synthase